MVDQGATGVGAPVVGGYGLPVSGVELLGVAVEGLLTEDPSLLTPKAALARTAALLRCRERLQAATLAAVRDVDVRELYTLEQAGSTGSWLRRQCGGEAGQLVLARRLPQRPVVAAAFAAGTIAQRSAGQLCTMLDRVPDEVQEARLVGVLQDGVSGLLTTVTGWTGLTAEQLSPATAAVRREVQAVLAGCLARLTAAPATRLEPAVLLLAQHLPAAQLAWALAVVLDALDPAQPAEPSGSRFYLELQPVLDGEWDLRGHLDSETGALLAAELDRQERASCAAAAAAEREAARQTTGQLDLTDSDDDASPDAAGSDDADADAAADAAAAFFADLDAPRDEHRTSSPRRLLMRGARRHAAFCQLLRDAADRDAASGRPAPAVLLLTATIDLLEARPGALPALLHTPGPPVPVPRETLQRLGCHSELNVVVLDALGRPVGASTTLRSATRRQRQALQAVWGPWCAVAGCTQTATVPHHVRPWWSSHQSVLRDLLPLCQHDHRDLHEGHRTLRLKDGRHIDEHGWAAVDEPAY